MMRRRFFAPLLLLVTSLVAGDAFAQNYRQGTAEQQRLIAYLSEQFRIPEDSKFYAGLTQKAIEQEKPDSQPIVDNTQAAEERDTATLPVLVHIRGKYGIPVPLENNIPPFLELTDTDMKNIKDMYMEMLKNTEEFYKAPPLPLCRESHTFKELLPRDSEVRANLQEQEDEVIYDILFMPEGEDGSLIDPQEVFGQRVDLVSYTSKGSDMRSYTGSVLGITCLPSRLRVTKTMRFLHEGKDALKNFDKKPNGKGEFHAGVESYLKRTALK